MDQALRGQRWIYKVLDFKQLMASLGGGEFCISEK